MPGITCGWLTRPCGTSPRASGSIRSSCIPGGEPVNAGPFFDWLIAGAALVIGIGAPSPRLVDLVGAYTPPVIGALTAVPVYFLGRELFSRRAGLWAAFIVGVLPGQILLRSALGFTRSPLRGDAADDDRADVAGARPRLRRDHDRAGCGCRRPQALRSAAIC